MIGLVLYAESGKKISSRTKDKTKGENLLRGNGRIQIVSGYFYFLNKNVMLIINVVSLMQKYRIMHNKATTSSNFLLYPVISFLLMFGLLIAGCSDNENEEELPAPDVPDYSTIIVKDIQNMPKNFTFDRVEVKVTGLDWQVIETLIFPYENGQIVMTLPATFPSERLQKVDRRNGDMAGYWTGTSNDGDALVATLGDFFVFNGDTRVGRIALSNWSGKGTSAEKATLVSYQYADRPFILTGSDKSYYYSECSFNKGWNIFANINPSEGSSQKVLRTTTVPESTYSGDWQNPISIINSE
jgi:hypothetical protein